MMNQIKVLVMWSIVAMLGYGLILLFDRLDEVESSKVEVEEKVEYKVSKYDLECIDGILYIAMENRLSVKYTRKGNTHAYVELCDD